MRLFLRQLVPVVLFLVLRATCADAQTAELSASANIPLTVDGLVADNFSLREVSVSEFMSFEQVEIVTRTPWDKGEVRYSGVRLSILLKQIGAYGRVLRVHALNDYHVDIPVEDVEKYDPILAIKREGQFMDISDKGPFFVVYPFTQYPEIWTEKYFARCTWQVDKITIN